MHLEQIIYGILLLLAVKFQPTMLELNQSCVHFSHGGDLVVDYNSNLTFSFSVSDSENCTKDLNVLMVHTIAQYKDKKTSEIYCYFYEPSSRASTSRPEDCWFDTESRKFFVKMHVTEETGSQGLIQGKSSKGEVFKNPFTIRVRHPPEIKLLQAVTINGTINSISNITVEEHSTLTLQCFWREGNPPQNARILKDSVQLEATEQPYSQPYELRHLEFVIDDVQCWHRGVFTCEADRALKSQSLQLMIDDCDEMSTSLIAVTTETEGSPMTLSTIQDAASLTTEINNRKTTEGDSTEDSKSLDHTLVLYTSIASVFFFVIVVTVIFGILFYRKVIAAKQAAHINEDAANAIELDQLPASNEVGNRDSAILPPYASHIYEEIKDGNCRKKTVVCQPPKLPPKKHKEEPDDYLHPVASVAERVISQEPTMTTNFPCHLALTTPEQAESKPTRRRCNPPPPMQCPSFHTLPAAMAGPKGRRFRPVPAPRKRKPAAPLREISEEPAAAYDDSELGACGGEMPPAHHRSSRHSLPEPSRNICDTTLSFPTDSDGYLSPSTSAKCQGVDGKHHLINPLSSEAMQQVEASRRHDCWTMPRMQDRSVSDDFNFRMSIDSIQTQLRGAATDTDSVVPFSAGEGDFSAYRENKAALSDLSFSSNTTLGSVHFSAYVSPGQLSIWSRRKEVSPKANIHTFTATTPIDLSIKYFGQSATPDRISSQHVGSNQKFLSLSPDFDFSGDHDQSSTQDVSSNRTFMSALSPDFDFSGAQNQISSQDVGSNITQFLSALSPDFGFNGDHDQDEPELITEPLADDTSSTNATTGTELVTKSTVTRTNSNSEQNKPQLGEDEFLGQGGYMRMNSNKGTVPQSPARFARCNTPRYNTNSGSSELSLPTDTRHVGLLECDSPRVHSDQDQPRSPGDTEGTFESELPAASTETASDSLDQARESHPKSDAPFYENIDQMSP